jgi:hypothetical protein
MIRRFAVVATLVLSFLIGWQGSAQAATLGYTYNRAAAVAYAHKWSCNGTDDCRNPAYENLGKHDCTNFVSQALFAGGVKQTKIGYGYEQWWYDKAQDPFNGSLNRSLTWSFVSRLAIQLEATGRADAVLLSNMTTKYSGANPAGGDIFMYDFGYGEGYSHLALSTGRETYYPYVDVSGRSYTSITDGSGDSISQHSTDRDHAPWNWGYWTSPLEHRAKYKVKLLSMN